MLLAGVIVGLLISGVTAFPLPQEVALLARWLGAESGVPIPSGGLLAWIVRVRDGLEATGTRYPFLAYGTDWLAFAHLVIAVAFIGPYRDPMRNVWTIQWGIITCAGVVPLALLCGPLREIPLFWRLVDCSFGVVGVVPLLVCLRDVRPLEAAMRRTEAEAIAASLRLSKERFMWSDGWLLVSIWGAGGRCDRETLWRTGDLFNHTIFTDEEIDEGMRRLTSGGLALQEDADFEITQSGRRFVEGFGAFESRGHMMAMSAVCEALVKATDSIE